MIASNSGIAWLPVKMLTFFRQYIISSPKTAGGNTFPRYCTYLGVGFPAGKTKNGTNLVSIVPRMTIAIVTICCVKVII